jgi:hypothetical protein
MNTFYNKVKLTLASLVVVSALMMAIASPAFAKSTDTSVYNYARLSDDALSKSLIRDTTWASNLDRHISGLSRETIGVKLSQRADYKSLTQTQIVDMSKSYDLSQAEQYLMTAQGLIASQNGFDKDGNVTNNSAAQSTLNSIDAALMQAQSWYNKAS